MIEGRIANPCGVHFPGLGDDHPSRIGSECPGDFKNGLTERAMQARIVIVHKETAFLDAAKAALQAEGHEVDTYEDPTRAASALHASGKFEILIAEARTPRRRDGPGISIRVIAAPGGPATAKVTPLFLPDPVSVPKILEVVRDLVMNLPST
jgi:hypothetical protein